MNTDDTDRKTEIGNTGKRSAATRAVTGGKRAYSVCWLTFSRTPTLASITNRLDPP